MPTRSRKPRAVLARLCAALIVLPILLHPKAANAELRTIETADLRLLVNGAPLSYIEPYTARCFENSLR